MLGSDSATRARSYKSMAHLLASGVGLIESLNVISAMADPDERRKLLRLRARITYGSSLTAALRVMKFPSLDIALVALGEETGTLPDSMRSLGDNYERRAQVERSIEAAALLPMLLVTGSIVLKHVAPLVNGELSGGQYLLRTFSSLCIFALFTGGAYLLMKSPDRYPQLSLIALRVARRTPKLSGFIKTLARYRFFSALSTGVKAGCNLSQIFRLAGEMTTDPELRRAAERVPKLVERHGLAGALGETGVFEVGQISQIAVGEQAGRLESSLEEITAGLNEQLEAAIAHFREWAPRVLYVICLLYIL